MKAKIAAAALGLGIVVSSLVSALPASAAPQGGTSTAAVRHYSCNCDTRVTTTALNLRSGPGTTYKVLLVMPQGAEVQMALSPDLHQNGFVKVWYDNNVGWAYEQYLAAPGAGTGGGEEHIVGTAVTTASVNFRSRPGTGYAVKYVLDAGSQVAITDGVVNGFRQVFHAGNSGWVYDAYLRQEGVGSTGTVKTTASVNFRVGPGTTYKVIKVLAPGTKVLLTGNVQNGFREVTVNGTMGWIHGDYLA